MTDDKTVETTVRDVMVHAIDGIAYLDSDPKRDDWYEVVGEVVDAMLAAIHAAGYWVMRPITVTDEGVIVSRSDLQALLRYLDLNRGDVYLDNIKDEVARLREAEKEQG